MIVERTTYVPDNDPWAVDDDDGVALVSEVPADAHRIVVMSVPRSVGLSDGCRLISAVDMLAISMPLHGESLVVVPIQIQSHSHVLISHNNRQQCSLIFHQCTTSYCILYSTYPHVVAIVLPRRLSVQQWRLRTQMDRIHGFTCDVDQRQTQT